MSIQGRFNRDALLAPPPADATSCSFGWLRSSGTAPKVQSFEQGFGVLWGHPRFQDVRLAEVARTRGDLSAWHLALSEQGAQAAGRVHGRFAAVLVDTSTHTVWLVTDRFATWPLCHARVGDDLFVSDRADQVPVASRDIDPQAIFDYLFHHCIPAPRTAFRSVHRLQQAQVLCWQQGKTSQSSSWTPRFDSSAGGDLQAAKSQFLQIVSDSVAQAAEGADVGAFLSGGTDSSTVSGLLCRALGRSADTYSIGFDATGYDEMAYARLAAKHFGTRHHEYYVTPSDLLAGIPTVAAHYDQPFGNSSAVPAWICASRARDDGRQRLLAGDGGDELFGGNARYAKQGVFELYAHFPRALRQGLLEPMSDTRWAQRLPLVKKAASYVSQAKVPLPRRMQMYNLLWRLGPNDVLEPGFMGQVDMTLPDLEQARTWEGIEAAGSLDRMLAFDWKYTLADNDLPKVVGTTQLAGLDVAFPLLDDRLVDFSTTLPPDWKLKGQALRWFFKEALVDVLPPEIIRKKKHGFGLPFGVWACSDAALSSLAQESLRSVASRGVVRPQFIRTLLDVHLPAHPGYYGEMVWILMMLEFWLRTHAPGWKAPG